MEIVEKKSKLESAGRYLEEFAIERDQVDLRLRT